MDVPLACPHDRSALRLVQSGNDAAWVCDACRRRYAVDEGVVRFVDGEDEFYETHYADWMPSRFVPRGEGLLQTWPLWLMRCGWFWAVHRHIPADSAVVEVGCGSGAHYFAQRFHMVGVDIAHSGLVKTVPLYRQCIQVDAQMGLPFPDESVDAIINSFFWEHIPPAAKPTMLREWRRVLRPGGKLVMLYDVTNENPLTRAMKRRDAALYDRLFIQEDHHYGFQTIEDNGRLFEQAGFRLVQHRTKEKTWILSPWTYEKVKHFGGWLGILSWFGQRMIRKPWLYPYTGLVRLMDEVPGVPQSWGMVAVTVCQKVGAPP